MKKRLVGVLLCILLTVGMLVGCGDSASEKNGEASSDTAETENVEENEKVFHVGGDAATPGWIQTDDEGELAGFDYDMWQEIGKRTGYEIDYQIMEWDALWSMLESGRLDTVGNQISVTEEREAKYVFTDPYAYNIYCLMAAKDNEEIKSMDDLKSGMTIACETNTSDEIILNAINKDYGIELEPTFYDGMSVQDVALGRCDLWPRAETGCNATLEEMDNLKIVGKTSVVETNAYPFSKTERGEQLAEIASEAIREMQEDGTIKELSEKWFGMDISEQPESAK